MSSEPSKPPFAPVRPVAPPVVPPVALAGAAAALALTSVAAVLVQLYGVYPMRAFAGLVTAPATVALVVLSAARRDVGRRVLAGAWAGLWATVAYDLVRVPFALRGFYVFKSMAAFGLWLTGEPSDSFATDMVGWAYHFSNGAAFGIVYALFADRVLWGWGVLYGVAIEVLMLASPFGTRFEIALDPRTVLLSLAGHVVFGCVLGVAGQFPRTLRPGPVLLAVLVLLASLLGCALGRIEHPAPAAPATIELREAGFAPNWIRVREGEPVRWVNLTDEPAEVWSKFQFDSLLRPAHGERLFAFPRALVCEYYLRGKRGIEGYVIVEPAP
ncbi:MAG: hypothetical protein HYZ53_04970 [Planctomycetes bacterium]|nr:hypothetical protein [Planctomycetota bacterium]